MATTQERIDDLAAGLTHRLGLKKELKTVVEALHDDEDVLLMAAGEYDNKQGLVLATTARVFFYQRGVMGGKQEDFFYNKISSIQNDSGMRFGKLRVVTSGATAEIKLYDKKRAQEFGDLIRSRLHGSHGSASAAAPPPPAASPEERLAKLKGLRDADLITEAEYEEQRAAIISAL